MVRRRWGLAAPRICPEGPVGDPWAFFPCWLPRVRWVWSHLPRLGGGDTAALRCWGFQCGGGCGGPGSGRQGLLAHAPLLVARVALERLRKEPTTRSRTSRFRRCGFRHSWASRGAEISAQGSVPPPAPSPSTPCANADRSIGRGARIAARGMSGWTGRCTGRPPREVIGPVRPQGAGFRCLSCAVARTPCAGQALLAVGPHRGVRGRWLQVYPLRPHWQLVEAGCDGRCCVPHPCGHSVRRARCAVAAARTVWARGEAWRVWARGGETPALVHIRAGCSHGGETGWWRARGVPRCCACGTGLGCTRVLRRPVGHAAPPECSQVRRLPP